MRLESMGNIESQQSSANASERSNPIEKGLQDFHQSFVSLVQSAKTTTAMPAQTDQSSEHCDGPKLSQSDPGFDHDHQHDLSHDRSDHNDTQETNDDSDALKVDLRPTQCPPEQHSTSASQQSNKDSTTNPFTELLTDTKNVLTRKMSGIFSSAKDLVSLVGEPTRSRRKSIADSIIDTFSTVGNLVTVSIDIDVDADAASSTVPELASPDEMQFSAIEIDFSNRHDSEAEYDDSTPALKTADHSEVPHSPIAPEPETHGHERDGYRNANFEVTSNGQNECDASTDNRQDLKTDSLVPNKQAISIDVDQSQSPSSNTSIRNKPVQNPHDPRTDETLRSKNVTSASASGILVPSIALGELSYDANRHEDRSDVELNELPQSVANGFASVNAISSDELSVAAEEACRRNGPVDRHLERDQKTPWLPQSENGSVSSQSYLSSPSHSDMEISNEQFNTSPDFRSENNNWSSSQLNDSGVVTSQVSSSTYEMGCLNVDSVSALLASARSFTNSRLSKPVTQAQVAVQQAPSLLVSEEQSSSRSIYTESVRPNHFGVNDSCHKPDETETLQNGRVAFADVSGLNDSGTIDSERITALLASARGVVGARASPMSSSAYTDSVQFQRPAKSPHRNATMTSTAITPSADESSSVDSDRIAALLASARSLVASRTESSRGETKFEPEPTEQSLQLTSGARVEAYSNGTVGTHESSNSSTLLTQSDGDDSSIDVSKISELIASARGLVSRVQPAIPLSAVANTEASDEDQSAPSSPFAFDDPVSLETESTLLAQPQSNNDSAIDADKISALIASAQTMFTRVEPASNDPSPTKLAEPTTRAKETDFEEIFSDDEDAEKSAEEDVVDAPTEQQLKALLSSAQSFVSAKYSASDAPSTNDLFEKSSIDRRRVLENFAMRSPLNRRLGATAAPSRSTEPELFSSLHALSSRSLFNDESDRCTRQAPTRSYYVPMEHRRPVDIAECVPTLRGFRDQHRMLRRGMRSHTTEYDVAVDVEIPVDAAFQSSGRNADSAFFQSVCEAQSILSALGQTDDVFSANDRLSSSPSTRHRSSASSYERSYDRSYDRSSFSSRTSSSLAPRSYVQSEALFDDDPVSTSFAQSEEIISPSSETDTETQTQTETETTVPKPPANEAINDSFLSTLNEADAILSLLGSTGSF